VQQTQPLSIEITSSLYGTYKTVKATYKTVNGTYKTVKTVLWHIYDSQAEGSGEGTVQQTQPLSIEITSSFACRPHHSRSTLVRGPSHFRSTLVL